MIIVRVCLVTDMFTAAAADRLTMSTMTVMWRTVKRLTRRRLPGVPGRASALG